LKGVTVYGTVEHLGDGRWQFRFTRVLPHPQEKVWRAITEPDHPARWFPTTIEGDRAPGASLRFAFLGADLPPLDGEMLAFEPESVMKLQWGTDVVRIELRSVNEGTELTLLDAFEERGKAARDGAGWHECLDALEAASSGDAQARERMDRWSRVYPHYVESFGPEAATIGPPGRD
jgi:uncharacterized protein YndB with AHSA1/START domain